MERAGLLLRYRIASIQPAEDSIFEINDLVAFLYQCLSRHQASLTRSTIEVYGLAFVKSLFDHFGEVRLVHIYIDGLLEMPFGKFICCAYIKQLYGGAIYFRFEGGCIYRFDLPCYTA